MATTALTLRSNRWGAYAALSGTVASVAVDTQIAENFTLPTQFGDMLIAACEVGLSSVSADIVDPSYPSMRNGVSVQILNGTSYADMVGICEFIARGGTEARPLMDGHIELARLVLIRQDENFQVVGPVITGAGGTATVGFRVRGIRLRQA